MVTDLMAEGKVETFAEALCRRAYHVQSWLCIGLDPELDRLPGHLPRTAAGAARFCRGIVAATARYAAAFKINFAFFEALGPTGWATLHEVREAIPSGIPVIADAKRADIGNSSRLYAHAIFTALRFDAVTVNPYLGWDAVSEFTAYPGRGVFVLCKTSNPQSGEFQDLIVEGEPLYLHVARAALRSGNIDVGLVVGANQLDALRRVRALSASALLLVPGVGPQGGSLESAIRAGANRAGDNALIAVAREILYASGDTDFGRAAADVARERAAQSWNLGHAQTTN